jgi:hypothetical protein
VQFQLHLPCASIGLFCRTSMGLSPRKSDVIVFRVHEGGAWQPYRGLLCRHSMVSFAVASLTGTCNVFK